MNVAPIINPSIIIIRGTIVATEREAPRISYVISFQEKPVIGLLGSAALCLAALSGQPAWAQKPVAEAVQIDAAAEPQIDGVLDEAVWAEASWFGDFVQSEPDFGDPASQPTRVAFLLSEHDIFVAVVCDDDRPDEIRAHKLRYRDRPETDDNIQLIFDTYQDEIRGTIFVVNPLGAKDEGLVNGAWQYTWNWNEVWDVKAEITETGWQAEFRIPLRMLRYRVGGAQTWGVNVKREVKRLQEASYLSAPPPPFEISSLNYAGELRGLDFNRRQRNLQLIPYGLAGLIRGTDPDGGDDLEDSILEAGVDLKYSATSNLLLNATYNTDFSQVESDDIQVNLTRFSLFYPEKREFFLENADLFAFGHSGGFGDRPPEITPFFSRRIGIYDGETVPIDGGVRLTGKVGRSDIGVLSMRTGGVDEYGLEAAWYNVARLRQDLGNRSYIGGIFTDRSESGDRSTTVGIDGTWFITEALSFLADYLRVDDDETGTSTAGYAGLDLTTDPWGFLFAVRQIDDGFDPAVGFVRRTGFRHGFGTLRRTIRPGALGIRRLSFRVSGGAHHSLVYDTTESSSLNFNIESDMNSGDQFDLRISRDFERLFEDFELDEDLVFGPGDYTFVDCSLSYSSDPSRRWGGDLELSGGGFFDGDRRQASAELWFVFSKHLRTGGSYSIYDIDSDHGAVDWRLWSLRIDYTFSSVLSTTAYLQHNSSTANTLLNLRLRWILRNDSDLYLVYNESEIDEFGLPTERHRELALKVSYRFFL